MAESVSVGDQRGTASGTWCAVAAVLLGAALQRNLGLFDLLGVIFVVLAFGAGIAGIVGAGLPRLWTVDRILKLGLLAGLLFMAIGRQGRDILLTPSLNPWPYAIGLTAIAIAVVATLMGRWRVDIWGFGVILVTIAALGVWTISSSPNPAIDVFVFQQQGSQALIAGANPYAMRFPDIYGPGSPFYGPGLSTGSETLFGFPYPPLSLFLAAAGALLAGDYRYAILAAYLVAAVLIAASGESRRARYAAELLLLAPNNLFMVEQGWNEPFAAALVALVVFLEVRRPKMTPIALGLLMAVKQYLIGIPVVAYYFGAEVLRPGRTLRAVVLAFAVTLAVSLPLAVLAPSDFFLDVIEFQFRQPFRPDALNLAGLINAATGWEVPSLVGFMALAATLLVGIRWAPSSVAGFAAVLAASYLAFFLFGRWAFGNYYWFVVACLCIAIAAFDGPSSASLQRSGRLSSRVVAIDRRASSPPS